MTTPLLSSYFSQKKPSAIRMAQMEFAKRTDGVDAINVSVGNVSLPMHPAMQKRMFEIAQSQTPLAKWIVQYTQTVGAQETNQAFLHIIASGGFDTDGLFSQVTDGWTQAMELMLLGVSDANDKPILFIDPSYTNYISLAQRTSRKIVSVQRTLSEQGEFTLPRKEDIEKLIQEHKPSAIVVIPYDNPTGQLFSKEQMLMIAELCVTYNMRMVSDEAYRELHYRSNQVMSIRWITDQEVPGIQWRRMSIETASKVWNACGLRIWALVTDSQEFHQQCVAENTTCLCSNTIGQYIFWALAHQSIEQLQARYTTQRTYYGTMITTFCDELKQLLPWVIVSNPDASLYSIIDVRNIAKPGFSAKDFCLYCAQQGSLVIEGKKYTLLTSPMSGFYRSSPGENNPWDTQMRVAFVESADRMKLVPSLFAQLFVGYEQLK